MGGNYFIHDGEITVFDFADCIYGWFASDIATTLYDAIYSSPRGTSLGNMDFAVHFIQHFWKGYDIQNHLSPSTKKQVSNFLRFKQMWMFIMHARYWDMNHLNNWQINLLEDIMNDIPDLKLS